MTSRPLRAALAVLAAVAAAAGTARADEFRLEPAGLPRPLMVDGKVDTVTEASAVEPIGDGRRFLVAHDKEPGLRVVEAATGRVVGTLAASKFPPVSTVGPKWEGMARDAAGFYYVIGAHVGKTDAERDAKSYLFRFRLRDPDGPSPAIDDATVVRWHVARSLARALEAEGLDPARVAQRKVEGLTVRETKRPDGIARTELLVGLREPGDRVRVYAADLTAGPSPDAELELRPAFSFVAEDREGVPSQLTSLEHVPALGGSLVVTASEDAVNAFHGNTLWFVSDADPGRAVKVSTFEVAMKAEGLAVLGAEAGPGRTTVELLITYDNDPHATHIPSRFQSARLVRETR